MRTDAGGATVVAVGLISAVIGLVGATSVMAATYAGQQQAELAAEASVLAGSDSLNGLATGFPCEVATQIAQENMAKLVECRIVGFEMFVTTKVETVGMVHFASARAASPSTADSRER